METFFSPKQPWALEKPQRNHGESHILTTLTTEAVVFQNAKLHDLYKLALPQHIHSHISLNTGVFVGRGLNGIFSLPVWNMSTHLTLLETFHLTTSRVCWLYNTLGFESACVGSVADRHDLLPLVRVIVLGDTLLRQVTMCYSVTAGAFFSASVCVCFHRSRIWYI